MLKFDKVFNLLNGDNDDFVKKMRELLIRNSYVFGDNYMPYKKVNSDRYVMTSYDFFMSLVDGEEGINELFNDMVNNSDKRFIDEYKRVVRPYIDYSSIHYNFYLYNIYIMMKAYQYNRDDFDNFRMIINDVAPIVDVEVVDYVDCSARLEALIKIIQYKFYKDVDGMGELIRDIFKGMPVRESSKAFDIFKHILGCIDRVILDDEEFCSCGVETKYLNVIKCILAKSVDVRNGAVLYGAVKPRFSRYYNKLLLIGDRYDYLLDNCKKIGNPPVCDEIFLFGFNDLTYGLFEYLNDLGPKRDSFLSCVDIVFDSDTYMEMKRKVTDLKEACISFDSGRVDEALELIKKLNDLDKKDKVGDKVVMYPRGCMNMLKKPDLIETRMQELYGEINPVYSELIVREIFRVHSIGDLYKEIEKVSVKNGSRRFKGLKKLFGGKRNE